MELIRWLRRLCYDTLQVYLLVFALAVLFLLGGIFMNVLAGRPAF